MFFYEIRKRRERFEWLSNQFGINIPGLKYMVKLTDCSEIDIVKKGKNRYYSPELKK